MVTEWIQLSIFLFSIAVFSPLFGFWLYKVFTSSETLKFELFLYKLCGIDHKRSMDWKEYAISLLIFNLFGFILLFLILFFKIVFLSILPTFRDWISISHSTPQ
ncbi:potassium-transporting ATPase A subunit domain protein [Leptospira weilii str. Ecochallenge]|uniref:Potassium-transporting ATPase A subunit domain protein n=1 Tax=Leptospira weilii str. Ecochallenge TaxID=1049986 RepID=N1U578_9LEPT|nr:potassium-transporting ATPase A subunit domain protein [Leptospira weilii str. Ecochallenge]